MNSKRILSLVLGILLLIPMALTAFAYTTAYSEIQNNTENESKFTISGNSANFDSFGGTSRAPSTKTATISLTDEAGAWHLTNTGSSNTSYATGAVGVANTSNAYSQFVDNTKGMTFDLYAKFNELPTLATNSVMLDSGAPAKNPSSLYFSGLVFNLCSAEKYMADTSKSNNEMQAVFATYYNDELGTDTVVFLPYGNRNAWASNSGAITYFFDNPGEYARYTFTFDAVNGTTQFFINGVAQTAAGDATAVHSGIGLSYRATATTNFLNINLNNVQTAVANGGTGTDFYLDQLNVYPDALIPDPVTPARFEGDPEVVKPSNAQLTNAINLYNDLNEFATDTINPTFWNAFVGWIEHCNNIVETGTQAQLDAVCTGVSGNWFMNRLTWLSTAGAAATTGGSSATVAGTGTVIAANTPIVTGTDRIWISHSSYDGKTDAYGWTNASILLTQPGMLMSEYAAYNNTSYSIATSSSWRAYKLLPTKATGIYRVSELGFNQDYAVPDGGAVLAVHVNGVANGSVLSSTQNSVLFGDRNERATSAIGIEVGDYVKLEGVTMNVGAAATLDTTGTWYCEGDSRVTGATLNRTGEAATDTFNNFKSNAYMIEVDASTVTPDANIKLSASGNGSVSASVNGSAVSDPSSFTAGNGASVTVTASGANFAYWMNAENGALLTTESTFTFKFGVSALELVAVFSENGAPAASYNVTFKDSITGKVLASTTVAAGATVSSDAIPAVTAPYGYVFQGFFAGSGMTDPVESYAVNDNTTFFTRYKNDEASYYNLTLTDGSSSQTLRVRYAKIVVATASSASFTNWQLDGTFYSSAKTVQLSMPNADCALTAVNNGAATHEPSIRMIANFVDDGGNLMTTFVRDVTEGYTLLESGILMTRKATAEHLVVDTLVATVTKGISTSPETDNVFGFVKSSITSKAGTWLVRGYLSFKNDANGTVTTVYTDVDTLKVEGTGGVEPVTSFVAMTHNMRNGNTSYSAVAENAAAIGADVVGIQESGSWYYSSLKSAMEAQGYTAVSGEKRDNTVLSGEYNPIFYNGDKFQLHNSGTFWLSDTPDTMSKFDSLKYYRICTWVVLEDRSTGEFVQFFNTHLAATYSTEGLTSVAAVDALRFQQVKVLLTEMEKIVKNCPSGVNNIVLGGDFNMSSTHGIMKYITGSAAYSGEQNTIMGSRLRLARNVAGTTVPNSSGNYYTMDATGTLVADFDHLFVSVAGISVDTFTVSSNAAGSDHLPVYINAKLK